MIPLYKKLGNRIIEDYIDGEHDANHEYWRKYRKKTMTSAARIEGPFDVITREHSNVPYHCEDGYLLIDSDGYPYAVDKEEFEKTYEQIKNIRIYENKKEWYK